MINKEDKFIIHGGKKLNGEIINPGSPSYTDRGFIYSTNSNPTIALSLLG